MIRRAAYPNGDTSVFSRTTLVSPKLFLLRNTLNKRKEGQGFIVFSVYLNENFFSQ